MNASKLVQRAANRRKYARINCKQCLINAVGWKCMYHDLAREMHQWHTIESIPLVDATGSRQNLANQSLFDSFERSIWAQRTEYYFESSQTQLDRWQGWRSFDRSRKEFILTKCRNVRAHSNWQIRRASSASEERKGLTRWRDNRIVRSSDTGIRD